MYDFKRRKKINRKVKFYLKKCVCFISANGTKTKNNYIINLHEIFFKQLLLLL